MDHCVVHVIQSLTLAVLRGVSDRNRPPAADSHKVLEPNVRRVGGSRQVERGWICGASRGGGLLICAQALSSLDFEDEDYYVILRFPLDPGSVSLDRFGGEMY